MALHWLEINWLLSAKILGYHSEIGIICTKIVKKDMCLNNQNFALKYIDMGLNNHNFICGNQNSGN